MSTFINLSNHPSDKWNVTQLETAKQYGEVIDIPFPQIGPEASKGDVASLADEYFARIQKYEKPIVMIQGEFTFTYALVRRLEDDGIPAVSTCSRRIANELQQNDGTVIKTSVFDFVGFREYY